MKKQSTLFLAILCCLMMFSAAVCENSRGDEITFPTQNKDDKSMKNQQRPA